MSRPLRSTQDAAPRRAGPVRLALAGATGLIGGRLIAISSASEECRIVGIARREVPLAEGARVEVFVAEPDRWGEIFEAVRPRALISALGTTWKKAGRNEAAFRGVDQDLILATARAAHAAGVPNMVLVSAAGADARSKNVYMRVKGETEAMVSKVGFRRLDILRPGLLRGERANDRRLLERLGILASPMVDPLLPEKWASFRSIDADIVAEAALFLSQRRAQGRFTHDNEAMKRAAREWRGRAS